MVGGQVVDVEMTGKSLNKEQIDFIYRLKTGALLEASFMVGAALAGVSDDMIRVLEETGKNIGYAFQIQDDILDITSTTQELGKPVHSDEKNEKNTYVTVYGMEQAKEAVEAYSGKSIDILRAAAGTECIFKYAGLCIDQSQKIRRYLLCLSY